MEEIFTKISDTEVLSSKTVETRIDIESLKEAKRMLKDKHDTEEVAYQTRLDELNRLLLAAKNVGVEPKEVNS